VDKTFQELVIRELDRVNTTLEKQSDKIDVLTDNVTTLKIKSGVIASILGFVSGIFAVLFGKP